MDTKAKDERKSAVVNVRVYGYPVLFGLLMLYSRYMPP